MALIKYVPTAEIAEIQTALEIAEAEYQRATEQAAYYRKVGDLIGNKLSEYKASLDEIIKAHRKAQWRYNLSRRPETKAAIYREMMRLTGKRERLEPIVDGLRQMYDVAFNQFYMRELNNQREAQNAVVTARNAAGLKFSVYVNVSGSKTGLRADIRTMAEAVAFIYQNAAGLKDWRIFTQYVEGLTTRSNTIAEGRTLDADTFTRLIDSYDSEVIDTTKAIDAEISSGTKSAPPANDFVSIVARAIHYFTFDDFLTPIAELRKFCRENPSHGTAQNELAEWIEIAHTNGVEVPAEQPVTFDEIAELESRQLKYRHRNGLKFKVEDTLASLDAAFTELITHKSATLIQRLTSAKENLQADVTRMTDNLRRLNPTDILPQAKANIYADLLDGAKRVLGFLDSNFFVRAFANPTPPTEIPAAEEQNTLICDTQFAATAITSWLPAINLHENVIREWKAERADLQAGIATAADLKYDDVPG